MDILLPLLASLLVSMSESYRILAVMPMPGESHHGMMKGVLRALVGAGHHVTSYTPFPMDKPIENYTEIQVENTWSSDEARAKLVLDLKASHYSDHFNVNYYFEPLIRSVLSSNEIKHLLKSKDRFDLIITEQLFSTESFSILGHIFKVPVIGIQSYMTNDVLNSIAGNSLSMSYLPYICSHFSNDMTLWERSLNAYGVLRQMYFYYYDYLPKIETKLRRMYPDMPPLLDMVRSTSLYFVNDHLTADYAQPRTPNMIPVGGIHIQPDGQLPHDLQLFMDEAKEGVILFSLGTYVPDELQTKEFFDMYLGAFRRLRQRVLWKSRKTEIEGVPDNVLVRTWLPQQEILGHPNCVLFVTHGGQNSQLETVYYGVPVIAIPQFFDQARNAMYYEAKGVGIRLDEGDVTQESLYNTIRLVTGDKRYGRNMARLSAVFRDRPQSAAQSVVYWAEYVIRHEGAPHLRPVAATMPWHQRALLDVAAALILIIVAMLIFAFYFFCFLCYIRKTTNHTEKSKKQK